MVIANNDAMAMGAVETLKAHNKSAIPVFGVDALPEALALVKSGDGRYRTERCQQRGRKPPSDLAKNTADGKGAADGTNWKIDNKIVRVPYVGVDQSTGWFIVNKLSALSSLGAIRLRPLPLYPICRANKRYNYGQHNYSVVR